MPKKRTAAAKNARSVARTGEKYTIPLCRQLARGADLGAESHLSAVTAPCPPSLEHRRFFQYPPGFRPFRGSDLYGRIGGQPVVDQLVDHLYTGLEADEQLRRLFPRDFAHGRAMQKAFFGEWLGGPRLSVLR